MAKKPTYEELEQRVKDLEKQVSEGKRAEEALQAREEKFRALSEAAFETIFLSEKGICLGQNPAAEKMFGYTPSEAIGRAGTDWIAPESREMVKNNMLSGHERPYEAVALRKDGSTFPVEIQGKMICYQDRDIRVTSLCDITDRVLAEKALRESEERYRSLFDESIDSIVFTNQGGEVIDVNPAAMELFGYTKEEMFKMNFREVYVRPDEGYRFQKEMEEKGSIRNFETRLLANGSVEMDCTLDVVCHRGDDGSILEYQGIIRDISEAKRAQRALKASQQRLSQIINFLPDATMVIDLEGKVIAWNRAIEHITGIKAREMLGKGNYEYAIPFYGERRPVLIDLVGQWNKEIEEKYQYVRKEGESLVSETYDSLVKPGGFLWNRASLLYGRNGEVIGAIESIRDITDRKVAEAALKESEEKFRSLAENQYDVVWTVNENLEVDYISPSCFKMTGTTAEKTMGMNPKDFYTEESYQRIVLTLAEERQKSANEVQPAVLEVEQYHEDGHLFPVEITCIPIIIDNRFIGVQGISRDITEKKKAEEEIRKLSTAVEQSPSVIAITDLNGNLEYVNPKFTELTGYTNEEVIGQNPRTLKSRDQPDEMYEELWATISSGNTWRGEFHNRKKNGDLFWEAASVSPIFDKQGEITNYIKVAEDISERKQAEEALRESEERLQAIFEASPNPIVVYDTEGNLQYLNAAFTELFAWTLKELKDRRVPFVPDDQKVLSAAKIDEVYRSGKPARVQTRRLTKAGDTIDVLISAASIKGLEGKPIGMVVNLTDLSEQIKLQTQLNQAQKMEAIGTLAGGVAHDLNNILGGLVSYPELLLLQLPPNSPLRKSILTIQKSGEKAAAVVQDLLTLARRGVVVTEVVSLNNVISEYLKSPEHEKLQSYHPGVHIETRLEADILNILGSSTHLSKTAMNLISNAAEAMPEGGNLIVSTENRYIDRPIKGYDDVREGDYVVLTISDTGTGIASDDLDKIFEPFYTKKKMGRSGTGLGMAVVWGTVKDHNGYIDVQSTEGKGTTFTLYFSATREKLSEDKSNLAIESYSGNGESILVIDDVEEQRNIASGMLKELGYSVVSVSSGEKAVEYLKTNKVDLLLLDMIMDPGMDGLDTYKKILKLHPGQKAIIASGFSETGRVKEVQNLGAGAYIRKPLLLEKIGIAVKKELEK